MNHTTIDLSAWNINTLAQSSTPTAGATAAPATVAPVTAAGMPGQTGEAAQPLVPGTGAAGGPAGAGAAGPGGSTWGLLLPMVLVLGIMIIMSVFTGRRDKKKRAELMSGLERGDTVQLSGGMIGTIIDIRDEDVVVKFEEGRIRFVKAAVQTIIRKGKGANGTIEMKDGSRATASV